jgi:uncharacterized glyoxalase superfamily protein PhnB
MTALSKNLGSTIIPVLRYRDAPAAIDWLCKVFSFGKQLVVLHEDGSVAQNGERLRPPDHAAR